MKIVLVDSYSQIYRLFYAVRMLNNPAGEPVNALYGMVRLLMQLQRTLPSEYGAFVFDKGKAVKRVDICPEYKAQRPPMPPELRSQVEPIREWVRTFGWSILEHEGYEADDLIASVAHRRDGAEVAIVTGDKDIAQLTVDEAVTVCTPEKNDAWHEIHASQVVEKFGVKPELLRDYLALVGDTADNIAGVPGIGPKTAAKLLTTCGCLDCVLQNLSAVDNPKLAGKLSEASELLRRNCKLVALDDTALDGLEDWQGLPSIRRNEPDWDKLLEMARLQGFNSIIAALKKMQDNARQGSLF